MKARAARLLSGRNELSVLERESLAQSVLDDATATSRRSRYRRYLVATLAAAAATVALVLAVGTPQEFATRSGSGGTTFETICRPGPDCTVGGQLMFRVSNAPEARNYVAIFAQRADGLAIWYFPESEQGESKRFTSAQWIDQGVLLSGDHEPGEYLIYAVVSDEPLNRTRVRQLVESGGDETHELLRTKVTLSP